MKLEEILAIDSIETNVEVKDKNELLRRMVDLAVATGKVIDKDGAFKDILEREKLMSTGIGKGIALPHAKTNSVNDTVGAFVILKETVDFESLDGERVKLAFMLLGREANVGLHLRILSKISRILDDDGNRGEICGMVNGAEVIEFFRKSDENE
ncbi:MAG: PTS sugar transporter subunit IIA [Bacteroidetes bacterium]|nr:PTS sugar transporter subunit IIA [Bacteroidota bacterium]